MENGKIMYAIDDGVCLLKFVGRIACRIGADLDTFLDTISAAAPAVERYVVDLSETTYIDSTNLGVLAKVHLVAQSSGAARTTLFSTNSAVTEVLESMGFFDLFHIVSSLGECHAHCHAAPLSHAEASPEHLCRLMLDAHRRLMDLNEANCKSFGGVVGCLEYDLFSGSVTAS